MPEFPTSASSRASINSYAASGASRSLHRGMSLLSMTSRQSSLVSLHISRGEVADDSPLITLHVHTLTGASFQLVAFTTDTVRQVKSQILYEQNFSNTDANPNSILISPNSIVLTYKQTRLANDNAMLRDYGIYADTQISVFPHLHSGTSGTDPHGSNLADITSADEFLLNDAILTSAPGTIVVLCNQNSELFVLEVQLRNRHGEPKILRNPNGTQKAYLDLTRSSWTAEQISDALLQSGDALVELLAEIQRLDGPLQGLDQLVMSPDEASSTTIHSRTNSGGIPIDDAFRPLSAHSQSLSHFLSSRGASQELVSRFSQFELRGNSFETFEAIDVNARGERASSRELRISRASSSGSMETEERFAQHLVPVLSHLRADRPGTRHRHRTVADPCMMDVHEQSMAKAPLCLPPLPRGGLTQQLVSLPPAQQTLVQELSLQSMAGLPRPLSPPLCFTCSSRLRIGLSEIRCKCGHRFCSQHRAENKHACTWDWKTRGKTALRETLPLVKPEKLSVI